VLNGNGEKIWLGHDLENMLLTSKDNSAYFALSIPELIQNSDDIQISLWNRNGSRIEIESISIEVIENIWN